jgi:hypothetical protein
MLAVGFMCFEIESFIRGDEIFVRRSTAEVCRAWSREEGTGQSTSSEALLAWQHMFSVT